MSGTAPSRLCPLPALPGGVKGRDTHPLQTNSTAKKASRQSCPQDQLPGGARTTASVLGVRLNYVSLKTNTLFLGYSTICLAKQEVTGDRNLGLLASPDGAALITWKTPDTGLLMMSNEPECRKVTRYCCARTAPTAWAWTREMDTVF